MNCRFKFQLNVTRICHPLNFTSVSLFDVMMCFDLRTVWLQDTERSYGCDLRCWKWTSDGIVVMLWLIQTMLEWLMALNLIRNDWENKSKRLKVTYDHRMVECCKKAVLVNGIRSSTISGLLHPHSLESKRGMRDENKERETGRELTVLMRKFWPLWHEYLSRSGDSKWLRSEANVPWLVAYVIR